MGWIRVRVRAKGEGVAAGREDSDLMTSYVHSLTSGGTTGQEGSGSHTNMALVCFGQMQIWSHQSAVP